MTERTEHPCRGMTKAQIAAFEQIATGESLPRATPKTLARLVERGVIVRAADKALGRDRFGTISIPQYHVPLPIHWQWREWCSENIGDGEEALKSEEG